MSNLFILVGIVALFVVVFGIFGLISVVAWLYEKWEEMIQEANR